MFFFLYFCFPRENYDRLHCAKGDSKLVFCSFLTRDTGHIRYPSATWGHMRVCLCVFVSFVTVCNNIQTSEKHKKYEKKV